MTLTDHPDAIAFLQSICSDPTDDTPRLIYADWLEEHGEADRGTFIRVQIELVKIPDPPPEPSVGMRSASREQRLVALIEWKKTWQLRYYDLRRRERALLETNGKLWLSMLPRADRINWNQPADRVVFPGPDYGEVSVSRGFISHVTLSSADWLTHADTLCWSPGQTMPCPNCEGFGEFTRQNFDGPQGPCPDCGGQWESRDDEFDKGWSPGTGRVPRPFPATAHPLERVTLTTWPEWTFTSTHTAHLAGRTAKHNIAGDSYSRSDIAGRLLAAEWPGITFHLPEPAPTSPGRPVPGS